MRSSSRHLLRALAATAVCATTLHAQTVTGTVTGTVTDPSGAVVPGAQITAHNVDTGVDSRATSDSSGVYRIQFLPIGRYTVAVTAPGFSASQVAPFQLEALQAANFNVKLQAGGANETVTVNDAPPILDTQDPTLSGTFSANTIQNFPLNGLDFSALTLYVPGAVSTAGTSGTQSIERSTYYTDSVNLNGNRAQANNYTLDGIDLNETFNNLIAYSPAPDSLQEVKVLTANSPADYGNVNGGGVVAVLKSGTNNLHGSAYGYLQDYHLNANTWNNKNSTPIIPIQPFSQAQFGGTLGGPIKKDKLFFFVDYLGSRFHRGGTGSASVLTQAMRNGDFSALLAQGSSFQLYDSQNNYNAFTNNQGIPVRNSVAKYLFAHPGLYPLPNATPTDGIIANNLQGPQRVFQANNQGDVKVEYDPGARDKFTGFYSMGTGYDGQTSVLAITFPSGANYPTKLGGVNWVHIFSPRIVNSARVGFTRVVWQKAFPVDTTGAFGDNGDAIVGITYQDQAYQGFTNQHFANGPSDLGNEAANNASLVDNTYSYIDNLTVQLAQHTLSMGVQALRYQNNYPTSNNNGYLGQITYSGNFTQNPFVDSNGYAAADFLLDYVTQAQVTLGSINVGQRQWRSAAFISDSWKATPNLTLTYGVRYEYDQPWIETNNKTGNVNIATGQVIYADHVPTGAPVGSGVCSNRACYQPNYAQVMPRIGFAYQATPRFVVRGGYGATSFFEGNSSNQRLTSITPFVQAINAQAVTPSTTNPGAPRTAEQGFTGGTTQYGGSFNVYPQNIQPAYIQEYSFTTETALTRTASLQVGYLGETGQHIEDYGNLNQYHTANDPTSAPYYNNQYLGINAVDPSVSLGSNSLLITESRAAMNYNALQAVLRQREFHGLEFTLNYTYAKALTNSLGNYSLNVNGYSGAFQNYYDSAADWGPAGYDVRHNFSGTGVYALPIGHGKAFLSNTGYLVDELLGGWKISTAAVAYSGFPETAYDGNNNFNTYGQPRPNQYRALKIVNRTLGNWFGTDPSATPCLTPGVDNGVCAFGVPASGSFGTARNGDLRGPRFLNVDMSAFKDFRTFREESIGFRFDAFNTFNIASYGNPDSNIQSATFGNVSSQTVRSQERRVQFSANYRF